MTNSLHASDYFQHRCIFKVKHVWKHPGFERRELNVNWKHFKDILVSLWWMPWMGVSPLTYAIEVVYCIPVQQPSDSIVVTASSAIPTTVYPKKYAHGFVVLCFVVVMQSFIMNSHEVFIHIHQGCFAGTGVIVRLPQCQWSKPDGYGKISQCITTTKHNKPKPCAYFLGYTVPSDSIVVTASSAIPTSSVPKLTLAHVGRELFKDI